MKILLFLSLLAMVRADCQPGYFECPSSGQCIPDSWVCDGDNDCGDRADEPETCPACANGRWECANGACIPITYICDGDNDCGDGSDERDPVTGQCPACPNTHFQCTSGRCIPTSYICDGDDDCGDGSDEPGTADECPPCAPTEFQCSTGRCISGSNVCDGRNDCRDPGASDENQDCPPCPDSQFQCNNGACASQSETCDGGNDCGDWTDENEEACPCAATEHRCAKEEGTNAPGACIPAEWICDWIYDCPLKDDEANCTDKHVKGRYAVLRKNKLKTHKLPVLKTKKYKKH